MLCLEKRMDRPYKLGWRSYQDERMSASHYNVGAKDSIIFKNWKQRSFMSVKLENDTLIVKINKKGAELFSLVNKRNQLEYMWSGDPQYWGKTAPILFPIVGTLKDNRFHYKGKSYSLPRHGFARELPFNIRESEKNNVIFSLNSTDETLRNYPFIFELQVKYRLSRNTLAVTYQVTNSDTDMMYFSVGGHPAFKVPLTDQSTYSDYYLEFDPPEDIDHWPISKEGLIETKSLPLLVNSNKLKLTKELFYHDALVLKNYRLNKIGLKSNVHPYGLNFRFDGFPFFGIWAAKGADFVCLEPWCGVADSINHNQELATKEGIQTIRGGETWSRTWSVELF
jgi:galactose mutarotase-like enzyme